MLKMRAFTALVLCHACVALAEDKPLHTLIDEHFSASASIASRCSDAEFLRRVSLDLTGMTPTADEVREFLADASPDKRIHLVDRLLASPHYARRLAISLDVMLMERRANQQVSQDEWHAWLLKSVRENKPWNVLAREILSSDGDDPALRPAARFALDRGAEPNLLARDVGRIFFGRDLQCAQCHDHPLIDDYRQADYQGLLALVSPGYALVRKEGEKQITVYAEKAGSEIQFESVFDKGVMHRTGPRLIDDVTLDEPFFLPGEEYQVAPADNVKSVPKFSRRAKLAELATSGANRAFNENIANRLWSHMLGRGLVHPADMHHPDNPPVNPALLQLLGERFAAMNYDIRGYLREIALSETYQRTFDMPSDTGVFASLSGPTVEELEQRRALLEQTAKSSYTAYATAADAWREAQSAWLPAASELDAARNQYAEAKKKADETAKALADAQAQLAAKLDTAAPVQQAAVAAQQVIAKLPEDKDLAAAAQKFIERSGQFSAEIAALQKAVEEKTAAHQAPSAALAAAKGPVDAALAKVAPLREAVKTTEQAMLLARRQMWTDATAVKAHNQQVATRQKVTQFAATHQTATAAADVAQAESQGAEFEAARAEVAQHLANDFTLATLKPLSPEQLCWSIFRATGVYDRYWQAEAAELDKASPLSEEQKHDAALVAARQVEIEQRTFDKLKGNVTTFVQLYAAGPGQPQGDFFATADQALFAANGGALNGWTAPAGGNVTERMMSHSEARAAAEELYLAVLNRMPSEAEIADVAAYLANRANDRNVAAQELVWASLTSAEFRFNH